MSRLWDKGAALDAAILRFTVGEDHLLDQRLVRHDVHASIAHARMLCSVGLLSAADAEALVQALTALGASHERGEWSISLEEEDAHTALESRLVAQLGEAGKRIHLGRSRNDQVLTALRLYLRAAGDSAAAAAELVAAELDALAARQGTQPLPGYTHMQRAMPSSVALWANGFAAEIRDDAAALHRALTRAALNPLGSAAGYGVPFLPLNREQTTAALGFAATQEPVTACQLSRGKAEAALAFELCLLLQDYGRLAADLCLFATAEFAFVKLPDAFTTGSSIMPQKRNPDVFELLRARAAQAPADLLAILNVPAKLSSGYHRDLQLIKAPLFRVLDCAEACSAVLARALPGISFDAERCSAAMDASLGATEEACRLVAEQGLPFRDAYRIIAAKYRKP